MYASNSRGSLRVNVDESGLISVAPLAMQFARSRLTRQNLRLGSRLILFAYVAAHLANHALGLISVAAAEDGLRSPYRFGGACVEPCCCTAPPLFTSLSPSWRCTSEKSPRCSSALDGSLLPVACFRTT